MTTFADTDTPLDLAPIEQPTYDRGMSLDDRYAVWLAANPNVLAAAESLVAEWLDKGHTRVGIGMVAEVLRYRTGIQSAASEWKIDNSMRSRLARTLIDLHPTWADAFELRALASERGAA